MHERKSEVHELLFERFFAPLLQAAHPVPNNSSQYFIDLLTFAVKTHGFRVRQFFLQHKVLQFAVKLLFSRKKPVILAVLKLFKAIFLQNDEILLKYVNSNGFLAQIAELLLENRENLVFSATVEVFQVIYSKNIKKLIKSLCEDAGFREKLQKTAKNSRNSRVLSALFEKLCNKYEQYKEKDPFLQEKREKADEISENAEINANFLQEAAYFEEEEPQIVEKPSFSFEKSAEIVEKRRHLLELSQKMKRKLEEPEETGLILKKVHTEAKNCEKVAKLAFVFKESRENC